MNRSFAQFRRHLCVTVGAFTLLAAASSAAIGQVAVAPELANAQQAVSRADQADADQYAPELLASARNSLAQAQAAATSRSDRKRVPELALRARASSASTVARSNEAVAQAQVQQRRQEIGDLQRTLDTESVR